jgi:hypothetical protein
LLIGPLAPRAPDSVRLWRVLRPVDGVAYEEALQEVPANAPVSATSRVLAHLMHRREAYFFPLPFEAPRDTYPGGLAPKPSRADASRVPIVIARDRDRDVVDRLDFRSVTDLPGDLVVANR